MNFRFPADALRRFESEPDYLSWKDRLKLCFLELEDLKSIKEFLNYVKSTIPYLDILVNNAAQTISKPTPYYDSLNKKDKKITDLLTLPADRCMIGLERRVNDTGALSTSTKDSTNVTDVRAKHLFPKNMLDAHGEQLDLRERNSWTLNLNEVAIIVLNQLSIVFMICLSRFL